MDVADRIEEVRKLALSRLPELIHDPNPEIRREVASRIDPCWFPELLSDSNPYVRATIVSRLHPSDVLLKQLIQDPHWIVRFRAIQQIDAHLVPSRIKDPSEEVRWQVAVRAEPRYLAVLVFDNCFLVREQAEDRIFNIAQSTKI